jgi:hypothetical protein
MPAETAAPLRIAMWSGPRNISTAMMRSFGNRSDCTVVDEPFYGYYLKATGSVHPGREEIIASMDCDWRSVARTMTEGAVPTPVQYQKQLTHQMLPEVDLSFSDAFINCFLVREPARMIVSYSKVRPDFALHELGLPQQLAIYRYVAARAPRAPLVVDAVEVLSDPRAALGRICAHAGIPFLDAMLHWPPGRRETDGVWAPHWYAAVEASTGFEPPPVGTVEVPARYRAMLDEASGIYAEMRALNP